MEVTGDAATATSEGQAMVIHLSLVLLMDGLREFLPSDRPRVYRSHSVDSSFSLSFTRKKGGKVSVAQGNTVVGEVSANELVTAVRVAARSFADQHLGSLPETDAGAQDLRVSLSEFEELSRRTTE
jgi:hypothetical protein